MLYHTSDLARQDADVSRGRDLMTEDRGPKYCRALCVWYPCFFRAYDAAASALAGHQVGLLAAACIGQQEFGLFTNPRREIVEQKETIKPYAVFFSAGL